MRRALALVQLAGLAVALGAMLAPAPRTLLEKWSSFTIYPVWTPVVLGLGVVAALLSLVAPATGRLSALAAGPRASARLRSAHSGCGPRSTGSRPSAWAAGTPVTSPSWNG